MEPEMWEVILYALLNLIPYMVLALLTFKGNMRFSRGGTAALVAAVSLVQIGIGVCANLYPNMAGLLSIAGYMVYILFFIGAVKAPLGCLTFMMFLLANYASLIVMVSKALEYHFFAEMALQRYRWTFSLITFITQALTLPFLAMFVANRIRPALNEPESKKLWRFLWIVPLTFYIVWFYAANFSGDTATALERAIRPGTSVFMILVNAGSLIVYNAVATMVRESAQKMRLQQENYQLAMQNLQLAHMEERIDEARRARHDQRQHFSALLSLCDQGKYKEVQEYLERFRTPALGDRPLVYCANQTLNAALVYYLDKAQEMGARTEMAIELPEILPIDESDMIVLTGNMLENALEAFGRQKTGEKFLRMTARCDGMLVVTVDNSFDGVVQKNERGFLSLKRPAQGIGTESIRAITKKYNGFCRFEHEGHRFCVSVMLTPEEKEKKDA